MIPSRDYQRIEKAILFIEKNFREQPSLKEIADSVKLSEYHFHRLFKRWAGITPKQFLQFLTIDFAKKLLEESRTLLDVTYKSGLSSTSRLHDLFVTIDAVTPGEFKKKGENLKIIYGFHPSPFGECLLSVTDRGICGLSFVAEEHRENAIKNLKSEWQGAEFVENPIIIEPFIDQIFVPSKKKNKPKLNLFLKGTNTQIKVWEALMTIPPEFILSYDDIAHLIGESGSTEDVGNAMLKNPIAYIIPCHRIIRNIGILGFYKWGTTRKRAILGWEAANRDRNQMNDEELPSSVSRLIIGKQDSITK